MAEIEYLEINDITRMINVPKNLVLGVMEDKNVKRVYFKCKRIVGDNVDLSKHQIYIKYVNALDRTGERLEINEPGIYHCEDVSNQGNYITFSWLLSENVFKSRGFVAFSINATDGERTRWNTFPAIGTVLITITGGLQEVQERYPDIITQLLNRMDEVEKLTTPESMQRYVNAYLAEHNIETNPYIGKTIVAFGDSIIAGWGWKEGTGIITPLKERYTGATWINNAESGANMAVTSNPSHTPIVTQIKNYTGAADAIIFDGGVNDINSSIPVGSIESGYDASYNTRTFCGALESALQHIMDRYPLAVKLYIIPHSFAKDNSYVDSIYSKAIEICDKWNMLYLDMRKCSQIAMTSKNKSKYTYNPNSKKGDGVHPVESWYRTFYSPVIDQKLRNLGIGYTTAPVAPTVIAVTGVKLDKTTLTLNAGKSAQLTATVSPSNATNKSVTWSSNNSNVSVSGGKVTAKTAGSAIVTVTTADGGYTAQCNVTVNASTEVGHTELESLRLDGNCYFDTEILPDEKTNTKAKWNLQSGTTYIAGARDDNYKIGYSCTDNIYVVRGTASSAPKNTPFWADNWIIEQTGASYKVGDTTVATDAIDSFKLSSPYYLGNMSKNSKPAGTGVVGKIYYAQIYSGDTLQADMIPVKKSDGTLCLYDKVRKKYIYNAGTGTVTE
nr:MAG TPA: GDSL like Lipase Acylhydrolase [Caudoviricetes sp.]